MEGACATFPLANVFRSTGRCVRHFCLWQLCLGALEGAYTTFALGKCVKEHWKYIHLFIYLL